MHRQFGKVFKGLRKDDGEVVAIKILTIGTARLPPLLLRRCARPSLCGCLLTFGLPVDRHLRQTKRRMTIRFVRWRRRSKCCATATTPASSDSTVPTSRTTNSGYIFIYLTFNFTHLAIASMTHHHHHHLLLHDDGVIDHHGVLRCRQLLEDDDQNGQELSRGGDRGGTAASPFENERTNYNAFNHQTD